MNIPFSTGEFFNVFELYNTSIWPTQVVLVLLALVCVVAIIGNGKRFIVPSILSFLWLWMGLVYHIAYFSAINPAAYLFGSLFIIQGILFLYFGILREVISLKFNLQWAGVTGIVLMVYALIFYPLLGYQSGHIYPRSPTFGAPCPTTIFTFGVLLFSVYRIPWYLIVIPFLWSLVGFSAAMTLSIKEDFGLVLAGLVSTFIIVWLKPKSQKIIFG